MELRRLSIHGRDIAFRTAGKGPVVLLLHGMAGSSATWRHIAPALAQRFTVLAPDLLGHGDSSKPPGEYSVGAHANLVRDLLAALGHERATVVGQSFGGGVSMQLAYQFPAICERLVLVSSGGLGREVSPLLRSLSLPGAEHLLGLVCSAGLRMRGERMADSLRWTGLCTGPVLEEVRLAWKSLGDHETRTAFFRTLRSVVNRAGQSVSATDRLYLTARVPTLIIWGREDKLIPVSHALAAHEAIPASRLVIFERAGHFPHCEEPERFAQTLVGFIDSSEPARLSSTEMRDLLRGGGETLATPIPVAGAAAL